jgi:hypothetical protein
VKLNDTCPPDSTQFRPKTRTAPLTLPIPPADLSGETGGAGFALRWSVLRVQHIQACGYGQVHVYARVCVCVRVCVVV